jgi:hypothetical protein
VLADVIWYAQERFKPRFIVDLATLTGRHRRRRSARSMRTSSPTTTGWRASCLRPGDATRRRRSGACRSPKAYDQDDRQQERRHENIGRTGTAARSPPRSSASASSRTQSMGPSSTWPGTAMDLPARNDINPEAGASGWGVRLLDRLGRRRTTRRRSAEPLERRRGASPGFVRYVKDKNLYNFHNYIIEQADDSSGQPWRQRGRRAESGATFLSALCRHQM